MFGAYSVKPGEDLGCFDGEDSRGLGHDLGDVGFPHVLYLVVLESHEDKGVLVLEETGRGGIGPHLYNVKVTLALLAGQTLTVKTKNHKLTSTKSSSLRSFHSSLTA